MKKHFVYIIIISGVVRYIGITKDVKARQKQHNNLFRTDVNKILYKNIRLYSDENKIVLKPIKSFFSKKDAEKYEAYLILKDYFTHKQLWQEPPSTIYYHR